MKKEERLQYLQERLQQMQQQERALREQGISWIAGVDEVGRGPLAGPVVAACVVLPQDFSVLGVDDSKKLSEKKREVLYDVITQTALAWGVGMRDNTVIDTVNILEATKLAMADAIAACGRMLYERSEAAVQEQGAAPVQIEADGAAAPPTFPARIEHVLIDALTLPTVPIPQTGIIHGDGASVSIAAASIVAKVTRDRMMVSWADEYPWYGFEHNKGYGTAAHYEGLRAHGLCPLHRKSFLKNIGLS